MKTLAERLSAIRADSAFKAALWHYQKPNGKKEDVDQLLWLAELRLGFHQR